MDAFAPARALYLRSGFSPCERFGEYVNSSTSVCMAMDLAGGGPSSRAPLGRNTSQVIGQRTE
jgi:hypothetical protein